MAHDGDSIDVVAEGERVIGHRGRWSLSGRGAALAAWIALLALSACTPADPTPPPSPGPSATSATPSESGPERQMRLDYEAAEKAYLANRAERVRLFRAGGASSPTPALRVTATGRYLQRSMESLESVKSRHLHATGTTKQVGQIIRTGWTSRKLQFVACENNDGLKLLNAAGKDVTPRESRRYVQHLTSIREHNEWKISDAVTDSVKSFEGQQCVG